MKKTLSVAAIKNGTVIDHIPAGHGLRIVRLLHLAVAKKKVTIGLNLPSESMGYKDLIKVEDREITEEEGNQIAVFAPDAKISIIQGFQLKKKFQVSMPEVITQTLTCPNQRCITNHEKMATRFWVDHLGQRVHLRCYFCEKSFAHDTV